jgi:hypothetical protein
LQRSRSKARAFGGPQTKENSKGITIEVSGIEQNPEILSLIVTARVELFKAMPDVGPSGGGPGSGSKMRRG